MEIEIAFAAAEAIENTCPICQEIEVIHAISPCDHHICYKCSTRLRLLHQQFYCPICRAECPMVLFAHKIQHYSKYNQRRFINGRRLKAMFEDKKVKNSVDQLLAHQCSTCLAGSGEVVEFGNFKALQEHVRKTHQLFFCDICTANVKLFSSERKSYTRSDLALHKRKGDPDDTSFKGHPLCEFCDTRFLDTDELWRHLRKDHYFCHFCDADGSHIFFGCYEDVKEHFKEEHYLCEEDECANVQFTNSFRSELDLKAHISQHHLKGVKRSQQRQVRTLGIEFNYGESRRGFAREQRKRPNRDERQALPSNSEPNVEAKKPQKPLDIAKSTQEEIDISRAVTASLQQPEPQTTVDVGSTQDFPMLGGDAVDRKANSNPATVTKKTAAQKAGGMVFVDDNEEFPGLSYGSVAQPPSTSLHVKSTRSRAHPAPAPAPAALKAKSNPWNDTEDEFPTLSSSKPKPLAHGWNLPKPQPKPAMKFINNSKSSLNSEKDFPSLGGTASSNLASIGSWIHHNGKSVAAAPEIAQQRSASAPYLNHYAESTKKDNSQTAKVDNNKNSLGKAESVSAAVNQSNTTKSKKAAKKSHGEAAGTDSSPVSNKSKENNSSSKNSLNGKVKSGAADTNVDKVSKKSTKGKKDNHPASKPHAGDTGNSTSSKSISNAGTSTKPEAHKDSSKSLRLSKKMTALEAELSKMDSLSITTDKPTTDKSNTNELHPKYPLNNVDSDGPRQAPKVDNHKPTSLVSPATTSDENPSLPTNQSKLSLSKKSEIRSLTDFDYPPLAMSSSTAKHKANTSTMKPPPGLSASSTTLAPPPGLAIPIAALNGSNKPSGIDASTSKPPGLSSLADLILSDKSTVAHVYTEPVNFSQRNKKLSFKLKELIYNDMDKFHKFKNYSTDFRSDKISARQFYDSCSELLGEYVFLEILTELLVLLPDLTKQQNLYQICKDKLSKSKKENSWRSSAEMTLLLCPSCNQVLLQQDASYHEAQHGVGAEDFPLLSSSRTTGARKAW